MPIAELDCGASAGNTWKLIDRNWISSSAIAYWGIE